MKDFSEKLKKLPTSSGVYQMLDEYGQILYVGKAKNLKNRVRQYFQNSSTKTEKTMLLVEKIADFRYIVTRTEVEALVLENNLIKKHKPYYNILLKDDKSYPYIRINLKQDYPEIEVTRRLRGDGSKYFGPYMIGLSARMITDLIHSVYPVRSCHGDPVKGRKGKRECLNFHIERCLAPCTGRVTKEEYRAVIKKVTDFLNGNEKEVRKKLTEKLEKAAAEQDFERAITYRDQLQVLEKLVRKQSVNLPNEENIDIFTYATNGMYGVVNYTVYRGGKMLGAENIPVDEAGRAEDILSNYVLQFYDKNPVLCDEILVSEELEFATELSDYITEKKKERVHVLCPKGGFRKQLIDISYNNASEHLQKTADRIATKEAMTVESVAQLQQYLHLPVPPKRMECYDISNISGVDKVASMVVFVNGEPAKQMYRRFRIKTVKGIDDFASMKEVITRRIGELKTSDDISFSDRPDLIIVDGGKGQLSSANAIVEGTGITIAGLAKREEEVFFPHRSDPEILPRDSLALHLLQRIRDEAHRFAITYHRALRRDRQIRSNLRNIPGVGKEKARALLTYFKKVEKIAAATQKEIMQVDGFGKVQAKAVYDYFHPKEEKE